MKHIKLFENKFEDVNYVDNIIEDYNYLLKTIKPIALKEYYRLAEDKYYTPDSGDKPDKKLSDDNLQVNSVTYFKDYKDIYIVEIVFHNVHHYERIFEIIVNKEDYIISIATNRFGL